MCEQNSNAYKHLHIYTYVGACMFFLIKVSTCVHYTGHNTFIHKHCCSMCLYTQVPLMCGTYLTVHSATHAFLLYLIRYRKIP